MLNAMPNVDGIVPIVHQTGCGMSGVYEGYDTLMRTLKGYARNPNFGGILLVGLGCEVMQVPDLVGQGRLRPDGNFRYMTIQGTGGTRATASAYSFRNVITKPTTNHAVVATTAADRRTGFRVFDFKNCSGVVTHTANQGWIKAQATLAKT